MLPGSSAGEREVEFAAVGTAQGHIWYNWSRTISARRSGEQWRDEFVVKELEPAAVDFLLPRGRDAEQWW